MERLLTPTPRIKVGRESLLAGYRKTATGRITRIAARIFARALWACRTV